MEFDRRSLDSLSKKHFEAKRKHHYVWAKYLKGWSSKNRDVFYTTKKGKIRFDSADGIAFEEDFYKIPTITQAHKDFIKEYQSPADSNLIEYNLSFLQDFIEIQELESQYQTMSFSSREIEKLFHATRCNAIENLHSMHEMEMNPILDSFRKRDLSILDEKANIFKLMNFLGQQIARTRRMRDVLVACVNRHTEKFEMQSKLFDECKWFIQFCIGNNIGFSLFQDKDSFTHSLLINESKTSFIASDYQW